MHLRHIDPRSIEWMDAMVDEGKAESEVEVEASGEDAQSLAPPTSRTGEIRATLTAPPR
jgi:hypothetical protein